MECPTRETLIQLCRGDQPPEDEHHLVTHIDGCDQCQALLAEFGETSFAVADSLQSKSAGSDSIYLDEQLSALKSDRPSSAGGHGSSQFQDVSPWIDTTSGALGRIDEYDLVRFIGRGGMGIVFEAFDSKLQRPVALKLMSPALLAAESNSERFLREARTAAAINHPNVVSIYAVSTVQELPYLVMELVDGESLHEKLEEQPIDSIDGACELAAQIADGLAAAHANGVVHRDIKPANILVERDTNRVKLTDFGLARRTSDEGLTHTGTLLGTPEYLAPEQIDGRKVDYRADLFSLGSVIYHMCAGVPPYGSNSIASTLHAVATTQPTRLTDVSPNVPAWLCEVVAHLHAKQPEARPADAATVAGLLRAHQRPPATVPRNQTKSGEHRGTWTAVVAAVVTLLVGFLLLSPLGTAVPSPFVAENSEELMAYFEQHEGDLEIVLTSDGPYRLEAMRIEGRSITIIADEGDQPTLIFGAEPHEAAIRCDDGQLEFVGLRIEMEDYDAPDDVDDGEVDEEFESMITCASGKLSLLNCEIHAGLRHCLGIYESECHVNHSELYSVDSAVLFESSDTTSVHLEETDVESDIGFEITSPMEGQIVLELCTLDGLIAFELVHSEDTDPRLDVSVNDSDFLSEQALLSVREVPAAIFEDANVGDLLPALDWQGEGNRFPATGLEIFSEADDATREIALDESMNAFNREN